IGNIIPIIPPAIEGSTTRLVATTATTISTSAPMRSNHGARLKNSHHKMVANAAITPARKQKSVALGIRKGTTNHDNHCTAKAMTPGHRRSDRLTIGCSIRGGVVMEAITLRETCLFRTYLQALRSMHAGAVHHHAKQSAAGTKRFHSGTFFSA